MSVPLEPKPLRPSEDEHARLEEIHERELAEHLDRALEAATLARDTLADLKRKLRFPLASSVRADEHEPS